MALNDRNYVGRDVLSEAKDRIRVIFDVVDSPVVLFSGGKDSLAVLTLLHEVKLEDGDDSPVDAVFLDREFFVKPVIDFVEQVYDLDWVNLRWVCSNRAILAFSFHGAKEMKCWDPRRKWARQPPEYAEMWIEENPKKIVGDVQRGQEWILPEMYPGLVGAFTGIRASESLKRFSSIISCHKEEPYIAKSKSSSRVKLCRPIYDWQLNDVYKYIHESPYVDLPYIYQLQYIVGMDMRVAAATNQAAAKYMDKVSQIDPDLYDAIVEIIPEMKLQALYWHELDVDSVLERYGQSYVGVKDWIDDNIKDPLLHESAMYSYNRAVNRALTAPAGYTPRVVLRHFLNGNFEGDVFPNETAVKEYKQLEELYDGSDE